MDFLDLNGELGVGTCTLLLVTILKKSYLELRPYTLNSIQLIFNKNKTDFFQIERNLVILV